MSRKIECKQGITLLVVNYGDLTFYWRLNGTIMGVVAIGRRAINFKEIRFVHCYGRI